MIILLILLIIAAALGYVLYKHRRATEPSDSVAGNQKPPAKLLNLNTTTIAERQRAYHHGFRQQIQYDELQRCAEALGDAATLEAIRLGTYTGPLPEPKEDTPTSAVAPKLNLGGPSDAPIRKLQYFCIKDKVYHVSVWPKDQSQFNIVEFNIAGMSHRDNIDDYLGEFKGTLEAEPTNEYDPNAIKVLAPDGHHVGYVPKDMTAEVRSETTLPCSCFCYIGSNNGIFFSDCYIPRK